MKKVNAAARSGALLTCQFLNELLNSRKSSALFMFSEDLSLDLDVDLSQRTVVPMPRSGLFINFKAKPNRGAVLKLVTEDGTDLPVGAEATINGGQTIYEVVLRGELFVPEISFPASVRVHWDDTTCRATVPASENASKLLPRIGPITCRKMR